MAREAMSYGFGATNIIIPPGASNAVLVRPISTQVSMALKYISGGSLEIFQCAAGGTLPAVPIVLGSGYPVWDSEVVNSTGAPKYFLAATGATCIASLLLGLSE